MLRAYIEEALVAREENNAVETETGNRVRIDINIGF